MGRGPSYPPAWSGEDEHLIAQAAGGDSAALEILYDKYAPAVMGFAPKMLGDRPSAEEVVQETFGACGAARNRFAHGATASPAGCSASPATR
jgi:RNA polymerase sigma-70 factor (ECF subfamily)